MKPKFLLTLSICLLLIPGLTHQGHAQVDWRILKTLQIEKTPLDMTISASGKYIFVLTGAGTIQVYLADGTIVDTIDVGWHVDRISVSENENLLYLQSTQKKTIHILDLEFIQTINIKDSPFKGPADAPVVIAVFSDFQ